MPTEQLQSYETGPEDTPASSEMLYFTNIYNFFRTEGAFDTVRCEKDQNLLEHLYHEYGRGAISLEQPLDDYGNPVDTELEVYIQADVLQAAHRDKEQDSL